MGSRPSLNFLCYVVCSAIMSDILVVQIGAGSCSICYAITHIVVYWIVFLVVVTLSIDKTSIFDLKS